MRRHRLAVAAGVLAASSWFLIAFQEGAPVALAADQAAAPAGAGRISVAELKKLVEAGSVIVLDVRARDAYEQGHIPGAISVPLDTVEQRAAEWRGATRPVVTYCT